MISTLPLDPCRHSEVFTPTPPLTRTTSWNLDLLITFTALLLFAHRGYSSLIMLLFPIIILEMLVSVAASQGFQEFFNINKPSSDIDKYTSVDTSAPCGGVTPDFSGDTIEIDYLLVDGFSIATYLDPTHTPTNFLVRYTFDETAQTNWTQLYPIYQQTVGGMVCFEFLYVPRSYIGKNIVFSVVGNNAGVLNYQVCLLASSRIYLP
jgi:hypothetical protein